MPRTCCTAARALQQINNQITALQNEAQMLINQAKNLASLPYSSLQQLQQSIAQTQQLLSQAQRIAYDVNQIDQAFSRLYPQAYSGATQSQQLVSDAQDALAELAGRLLRTPCGCRPASWGISTRRAPRSTRWSPRASPPSGALQAAQAGNQLVALQTSSSPI